MLGVIELVAFDDLFGDVPSAILRERRLNVDPSAERLVQLFPFDVRGETAMAVGVLIVVLSALRVVVDCAGTEGDAAHRAATAAPHSASPSPGHMTVVTDRLLSVGEAARASLATIRESRRGGGNRDSDSSAASSPGRSSPVSLPPWGQLTAMDGYAGLRRRPFGASEERPVKLAVTGTCRREGGDRHGRSRSELPIATGAPIPPGSDSVPVERRPHSSERQVLPRPRPPVRFRLRVRPRAGRPAIDPARGSDLEEGTAPRAGSPAPRVGDRTLRRRGRCAAHRLSPPGHRRAGHRRRGPAAGRIAWRAGILAGMDRGFARCSRGRLHAAGPRHRP